MKKLEQGFDEERLHFLKTVIESDILRDYHKVKETLGKRPIEFGDLIPDYLKDEEGKLKAKSWLKVRLFEPVLASIGTDIYLRALLSHDDVKPEDKVPVNFMLASFLISTSLNPFALELINEMISSRILHLTKAQKDVLSLVFRPNKDYSMPHKDVVFQSNQVQDIRREMLRKSLDLLSAYKQFKRIDSRIWQIETQEIPKDLRRVSTIPDFSIDQILAISQKYKSQLKLSLVDGYLVWKFQERPAIYIKSGEAYYSPQFSKRKATTTLEEADRQIYLILEKLEALRLPTVKCSVCGKYSTHRLFFHREKGVIPVCEKCSKDPKIAGVVSNLKSTSRR